MTDPILYPIRNSDITTRLLPDGRVVLYNPKTMYAHVLSPLGSIIWEFCDGDHSVDEIIVETAELIGETQQDVPQEIESAASAFIADLEKVGLVLSHSKKTVEETK